MILRTWSGSTRVEDGDLYWTYLQATGVKEYKATPGNRGVLVVRRLVDERAELLLLTLWESMDAIEKFAGPIPEGAVFYPEDEHYLWRRMTMSIITRYSKRPGGSAGDQK